MKKQHVITAVVAILLSTQAACVSRRAPESLPVPMSEQEEHAARLRAEEAERARLRAGEEEAARIRALEASRLQAMREAQAELATPVYFLYDSHIIDDDVARQLRAKVDILRRNREIKLRIEGHADVRGSAEYNLALGQRRASAVRDFLVGHGIERDRLSTLSYGKLRPAVAGSNEKVHSQNRRAEFVVVGAGEGGSR